MQDMKEKLAQLTPRQREVLRLISLGCSDGDAAKILGLLPATINNHRSAMMRTLGLGKACRLTRVAMKYRVSPSTDELTAAEQKRLGKRRSREIIGAAA